MLLSESQATGIRAVGHATMMTPSHTLQKAIQQAESAKEIQGVIEPKNGARITCCRDSGGGR